MNQMIALPDTQAASDVQAMVMAIIAQQAMLDMAQIHPDTVLKDMGLDSLVMVEIVFALEEEFDVTIPFNANDGSSGGSAGIDLSTPAAIAAAIRGLRAA